MQKQVIITIVIAVVVGGVGFFGGMQYEKKAVASQPQQQRGAGGNGAFGGRRNGAGGPGANGSFVTGEILSKDDKSITVKTRDGSSKIVFYSGTTTIGKSTEGSATDLATGKQVTINGTANSDGSVTAQMIQIRPVMPTTPAPAGTN